MAKVSLSKAAKDNGVSLPTLSRWRKTGKITAQKEGQGYLIDTSEYDRIQELIKDSPNMKGVTKGSTLDNATPTETPNESSELRVEVEVLRERVKGKEKEIERLESAVQKGDERIEDLSEKLNTAQETVKRHTYLLEQARKEKDEEKTESKTIAIAPQDDTQSANDNLGTETPGKVEKAIRGKNFAIFGLVIALLFLAVFLGATLGPDFLNNSNGAGVANLSPAAGETP